MGKLTRADIKKAEKAIARNDPVIYDAADNMSPPQIVGNVKHMKVFKLAVARFIKQGEFRRD